MSNASSICIPQEHAAMQAVHPRTDGRTNGEALSPTRDLSSSVTRTRTYGMSDSVGIRDSLRQLIALLDEATGGMGYPRTGEAEIESHRVHAAARRHLASQPPDPDAARHWAELLGDLCPVTGCVKVARDSGWCHGHHPDEVAMQRAVQGQPVHLLQHEREEVYRRLAERGLTPAQISRHMNANRDAIKRVLADSTAQVAS